MEFGPNNPDQAADRSVVEYLAGADHGAGIDEDRRAELDELRGLLADPALWVEPPPELEAAVVGAIAAEAHQAEYTRTVPHRAAPAGPDSPARVTDIHAARSKPGRAGWRRVLRPIPLLSLAAALVAVVVSAVVLLSTGTTAPRYDIALTATDLAPSATGSATLTRTNSGWRVELDASGLPRRDGGLFYEAWLRNPAGMLVPIGTFNEGMKVVLWSGVSPADYPVLTVTRESSDGNQNSSGERVLTGTAVPD